MLGLSDTTVTDGVLIHGGADGGGAGELIEVCVAGVTGEAATCGGRGAGLGRLLRSQIPPPKTRINTAAPAIIDAAIKRFPAEAPNGSVDAEPVWAETVVEARPSTGNSGMVISCIHRGQATRMPI